MTEGDGASEGGRELYGVMTLATAGGSAITRLLGRLGIGPLRGREGSSLRDFRFVVCPFIGAVTGWSLRDLRFTVSRFREALAVTGDRGEFTADILPLLPDV